MRTKRRKRDATSAASDLTPMIDVVFQLLIFFILCTRFRVEEPSFELDLPKEEGIQDNRTVPREAVTIYCQWDPELGGNSYVVAIEARGRMAVPGTFARLEDLVIFGNDGNAAIIRKKAAYKQMHDNLVLAIEQYIGRSGANIEKLEVSFARNAVEGARSGTAPWLFVSAAVDAAAAINEARAARGDAALPLTFKFSDSLRQYG